MALLDEGELAKGVWLDAFLAHVTSEMPAASVRRLTVAADELYAKYGDIDPVVVAEAAWDLLPLEDSGGGAAAPGRPR